MANLKFTFSLCSIVLFCQFANSQHFLSTQGKAIVNENQDTILLRGMGLGGWMVQEGYMLQTAGFASPQHKIRSTIEELIGEADTELFYEAWLSNHVRRSDIDSLKAWGFNSVRLPMHYNLFTLPIEDEPVEGEDTWLDKGFELTDSLLSWCKANEMYIILDMHAAPGGQGYDEAISDYDPTKPSLWESSENRRKLTALWTRIAAYYADEEWIAGYDLLNEPNWDLPGGNALRSLYQNITQSIRRVDDRHMLFIEGNWFANDFTGLTPPWDDNFVYSPHKYWSTNDEATMQWVIDLRNQYNVPLYLGESGENSNVWFRDAIRLLEDLDIGWAWWPMKKVESVAGPLSITKSLDYQTLLDYWSGNGSMPSADFGKATLMQLTEDLKIENCKLQKDVIDAMFRQVYSDEAIPFKAHTIPGVIHASDYDLGIIGEAYYDVESANYNVSTGVFTAWNAGWQYRNDGVDIELSEDNVNSNGYNVGFMDVDEWMQYEVDVEESGVYEARLRTSSGASGGFFHLSMNGGDITPPTFIGPTGGWQNWSTVTVANIFIDSGKSKLRFHTDVAGYNLASFEFVKTNIEPQDLTTLFVSAETISETSFQVSLNKTIAEPLPASPGGFSVTIDGASIPVNSVSLNADNNRILNIGIDHVMNHTEVIKVTYSNDQILANDGTFLTEFTLENVKNSLDFVHQIPTKIEAEAFIYQSGVQLEECTDTGGGQNIGFLDVGDYLDYDVNVTAAGAYKVDYRSAAQFGGGAIELQLIDTTGNVSMINSPRLPSTGGWQSWTTTTESIQLPTGRYTMRLLITDSPFNLNWIDFSVSTSTTDLNNKPYADVKVFPNPIEDLFNIQVSMSKVQDVHLEILSANGRLLQTKRLEPNSEIQEQVSLESLNNGVYFLMLRFEDGTFYSSKLIKI